MKDLSAELSAPDWIRLNLLLKEALEVEGAERSAWLEALPPDAAPLRGLLIDLLLASSHGAVR